MRNIFVFTIDQVASRSRRDAVPELLAKLEMSSAIIPFSRTLGDEVQGVVSEPAVAVEITRIVLSEGKWHTGIGIGPLKKEDRHLRRSAEGTSPSFALARTAVEAAKKKPGRAQIAVRGTKDSPVNQHLEALLSLLAGVIAARTPSQWSVIAATQENPDATQSEVAQRLGMTQQGVAKSLATSLWRQENEVLPLLENLFEEAAQV